MLTLSGVNFILIGETMCPDELKRRSDGEYLLAKVAKTDSSNYVPSTIRVDSLQNPALEH